MSNHHTKCPNHNIFGSYFHVSLGCHGVRWLETLLLDMYLTGLHFLLLGLSSTCKYLLWILGRGGNNHRHLEALLEKVEVKESRHRCLHASAWLMSALWPKHSHLHEPQTREVFSTRGGGARGRDGIFEQTLNLSHLVIQNLYINCSLCYAVR